jgi:hypothetical protein
MKNSYEDGVAPSKSKADKFFWVEYTYTVKRGVPVEGRSENEAIKNLFDEEDIPDDADVKIISVVEDEDD